MSDIAKSVHSFDFSTFYTSIRHDLLESRVSRLLQDRMGVLDTHILKSMEKEGISVTR